MRNTLITLGIVGALALGGCNEYTEEEKAIINNPDSTIVDKIYNQTTNNGFASINDLLLKIDTVQSLKNAKLKDKVTIQRIDQNTNALNIYKFKTPDGKTYQLISNPEGIFVGDNHNLQYLTLKKGKKLTEDDVTRMFYSAAGYNTQTFEEVDGIMLDYNLIRRK